MRRTADSYPVHPTVSAHQNHEWIDDISHASHSPAQTTNEDHCEGGQQSESRNDTNSGETDSLPHIEPPQRSSHPMITRAKSGIFKPKIYNVTPSSDEPTTYEEAVKNKN